MQKFHPILFSTPMVQAIQEGRKTMTRRTIKQKDQPWLKDEKYILEFNTTWGWVVKREIQTRPERYEIIQQFKCPYGKVGDVLWVRETCYKKAIWEIGTSLYEYKADCTENEIEHRRKFKIKWKPSIFMPKSACRIFLEITDIKVERLQDISEEDAIAEGVESCYPSQLCGLAYKDYLDYPDDEFEWFSKAKFSFQSLWQKINGAESWEANPFVWVIYFKQIDKPENFN